MRIQIKQIMKATRCNADQARDVETYINKGDMLNWSEASLGLINTISRAVYEKLLRDAPRKPVTIVKQEMPKAKVKKQARGKPVAVNSTVKAGTKIAHAMLIYTELKKGDPDVSRQDIISALAHSMQIEKHSAAGYYQSCKKKVG